MPVLTGHLAILSPVLSATIDGLLQEMAFLIRAMLWGLPIESVSRQLDLTFSRIFK